MKIPVTNPHPKRPMYLMGRMIPGGETRHFEENEVPAHLRPKAPAAAAPAADARDPLDEMVRTKNAKELLAAIPGMTIEQLERLSKYEAARMLEDKSVQRKSVLAGIDEELLRRAAGVGQPAGQPPVQESAGVDSGQG